MVLSFLLFLILYRCKTPTEAGTMKSNEFSIAFAAPFLGVIVADGSLQYNRHLKAAMLGLISIGQYDRHLKAMLGLISIGESCYPSSRSSMLGDTFNTTAI